MPVVLQLRQIPLQILESEHNTTFSYFLSCFNVYETDRQTHRHIPRVNLSLDSPPAVGQQANLLAIL